MIGRAILPEIKELIDKRDFATLRDIFEDWHPSDLADAVSDLNVRDRAVVFRLLSKEKAAETFEYLDHDIQESLLKTLGDDTVATILNEMSPDDRTAFLEELPPPIVKQLIELLTPSERAVARTLLGFPLDSVARLMTPEYVAVPPHYTIQDVMDYIRQRAREVEVLDYIYVVGEDGKLLGDVQLKNLLIAQPEQRVSELMDGKYLFLKVTDTQESAIPIFKQYDRSALPVVSEDGIMLGIVTIDDVLDIVEEANTEDIQRFGGLEALDTPYIRTPVMEMVKKRAGWLVLLFLSEMLTATAMGHFENEIARAVVLALFVPLIISSGGNSGSQAATLIIRAMALKEIWLKDWWRVMKREAISGFCLGCVLGLIGFLRIAIWTLFTDIYGPHWLYIALTVSCSLVGVVMWGTLAGSMMPFLLRRLGFDPASSSAPFVATLVDVTGLVIYFSVASLFLRGILL